MGQLEETARTLLAQCTVRITTPAQSGTGFWVGPKTLLTCSHVVMNSNGSLADSILLRCAGAEDRAIIASAQVAKSSGVDLALLTTADDPPNHPCVFLHNLAVTGADLTSYGYPSGNPGGDQATHRMEGTGVVDGHPLLKTKQGQIDFGASGSPLLDDRHRAVCGVLTISRDVNGDLGGYSTQIEDAFREWPELQQIQRDATAFDRRWYDLLPLSRILAFQEQEQQRLFRDELDRHASAGPHPVALRFKSFMDSTPWHERIKAKCKDLNRTIAEVRESVPALEPIEEPDYNANYDLILNSLSRVLESPLERQIESAISDLEGQKARLLTAKDNAAGSPMVSNAEARINNQLKPLRVMRAIYRDLETEIKNPEFETCLLILGEVGSGKTQFLTSQLVADPTFHEASRSVVVIIRPRQLGNLPLLDSIVSAIRDRTGVAWESLGEFNAYVQSLPTPSRIIVAIDDLHTISDLALFLDQLRQSVSENTQLHSLRWVITIEHKEYIQIAGARQFWMEYGYIGSQSPEEAVIGDPTYLGSWNVLDELNYQQRTGMAILQAEIGQSQSAALDLVQKHLRNESLQRLLSTPFIAWILVECRELLSESILVNLNFLEFILKYWNSILPRLTQDERIQQRLKSCVGLITSYLIENGFAPPVESELAEFVIQKAQGKSDLSERGNTNQALALLERSRVLRSFEDKDPELEVVRRIDLCFEAFWSWKLAQRLRYEFDRAKKGRSLAFIETWFHKKIGELSAGVGILEFFLLEPGATVEDALWSGAALSERLPSGAVWFAASKLPSAERERLAQLLLTPGLRLRDKHQDLFGLIYFVSSISGAIPSSLGTAGLLRILAPNYAKLHEAALSDYFIFTLERLLPNVKDLAELEEVMLALDGCEVLDAAEEAADLTVQTMRHLQEDLALSIDTVMGYLKRTTKANIKAAHEAADRVIYSDWLIASFCKALVYQEDLRSFRVLSSHGWYASASPVIRPAILHRMAREANFALADWFREEFPPPVEDYIGMVSSAAESKNVAEREAAFFMIRHTRATHKAKAVRVDARFKPILEKIANDPDLRRLVASHGDFFRANQIVVQ